MHSFLLPNIMFEKCFSYPVCCLSWESLLVHKIIQNLYVKYKVEEENEHSCIHHPVLEISFISKLGLPNSF